MASITSAGIGSGLDVTSLVTQLVASERAPADGRLARRQSGVQLQISALGAYRSAMAGLQSAVTALGSDASVNKLAATSANTDLFSASAAAGATPGSYDVEVVALAQAHKLVSSAYASSSASVGTAPITIGVGAASFQVTLASGADSLANLRDAINGAADNKGVTATIVNEAGGAHLLLTAKSTGVANALTVSGLATTELRAASDAHVRIEGFDYYSASNTVTGALDGVTLNLKAPGAATRLDVALDSAASSTAINNFVTAYNKALASVAQLTRFDPVTKAGGPLMGDAAVRSAVQQLRNLVGGAVSGGAYTVLAQVGVTTATDGTLTVDASKLGAALTADVGSVQKLFSGSGGIATRMAAVLDGGLGDNGNVKSATDGLQKQLDDIARQKTALNVRMSSVEARYRAQFTALDSLIGRLRTTSDFLTRQLSSLTTG